MLLPALQSYGIAADSSLIFRFPHIYEPSGVVQLSNGDLMIIEDDGSNPLHIISLVDDPGVKYLGSVSSTALSTPVSDLEGIAVGREETLFLITSFSPTKRNKKKKKRERLVQFRIKDGRIVHERHVDDLFSHLIRYLEAEGGAETKGLKRINIEGIAFDKEKNHLLIGFRSPLKKGRAIVVVLENPYELFSENTSPAFGSEIITLDLGGGGIRGMAYDKRLGGYLITNEIKSRKGKLRSVLWGWDGRAAGKPVRIQLEKMKGVANIEGITPITIGSRHFLFMVCDDGNRKKKKGAHYILIDAGSSL